MSNNMHNDGKCTQSYCSESVSMYEEDEKEEEKEKPAEVWLRMLH